MSQKLKDLIYRIYREAYNKGNLAVLDEAVAEDYIRHQPPMPDVKGLEAFKKFVADTRHAYSNLEIKVEEIIFEGDTSAVRLTLYGRHTRQAPTIQAPPTGRDFVMPACVVSHWMKGKVAADHVYNDYLGLLQQLGVVPPPGMFA
jgi:predicted SnoaL-like aldol condensation-catalyzing enzyme